MSIPVPNLDDRSFADLVESARERIRQIDPEWTDLSVHDPGMVLVEAFAHLTDMLMYRLNRVPDKLYAVYLNLLGTALRAPSAAESRLVFTRSSTGGPEIRIPRGTQVSCVPGLPGTPQPVFTTTTDGVLAADAQSVEIPAADVALHDAVLLGVGTGRPGQTFALPTVPAVSGPGLAIAVEVPSGTRLASGEAVLVGGVAFRYCREVEAFADAQPGEMAVRVDRTSGTVTFAWWNGPDPDPPGAPAPGAAVRAWYLGGGGERGNVAAGQLTVLRTQISGLHVNNPQPASGGRDAEVLQDALRRAPQDFQSRDRAVTARDYELLAARNGAVARTRAFTRREVWAFASPGEVEVVLVPQMPLNDRPDGRVDVEQLAAQQREDVRLEVERYLQERATIGARPIVRWGLYKEVLVEAIIVIRQDEDADAVRSRIVRRLSEFINPLPVGTGGYGSGFGKALRVSNLYRAMEEAEPGVQYVESVRLRLDKVPETDAVGLAQAEGQDSTWFVARNGTLFRTTNAGDGWEACAEFTDESVRSIAPFHTAGPGRSLETSHPGMVAVATTIEQGSRVYVSDDLGESWRRVAELGFPLADLAWVDRAGRPVLLLAGEKGIYELNDTEGSVPVQNVVDPAQPDCGFYAVDSFVDIRGRTGVVVAAEASAGIWLSPDGGAPETFHRIRAAGEDVRCLAVQYDGPATFLWLGRSVPEGSGTGCARLKIDELARTSFDDSLLESWEQFSQGWGGGSCWGIHIVGDSAYAATQSGGVLRLQLGGGQPAWDQRDVNCGLPLRDRARFDPVRSVSGAVRDDGTVLVLAAGPRGVYRSEDTADTWHTCSSRVVSDVVTLPETWLFCSGAHQVAVRRAHD
ncbi:baseplate J/gp47 family protein [Paenarthrobacter sp. PH39-S1]|uniref:baseplate J/gp47 family protein n=1 Tax=Paenarthrobacter sp. PH39-S1 TaxID=3046204 RepID=UPI0024B87FCF|nr:baseplate J/gp47 family protein [Paenarthrobacter sp. PH39-S1]MDJ0356000.1 baseplate J/gp47 family protein [Paenarthrobacter sp. PH39-S1]